MGLGSARSEVEAVLGTPNAYNNGRVSIYSLYRTGGRVFWIVPIAAACCAGEFDRDPVHYHILFEYDENDLVVRYDIWPPKAADDSELPPPAQHDLSLTKARGFDRDALGVAGHYGAVAISPDGQLLATAGLLGRLIHVWSLDGEQDKPVFEFEGDRCLHICGQISLTYSNDGTMFAAAGFKKVLQIRDAKTGEPLLSLNGHKGRKKTGNFTVAFSPDNRFISAGGWSPPQVVVWDVRTGEEVGRHPKVNLASRQPFSVDGSTLALLAIRKTRASRISPYEGRPANPKITLWNVETGDVKTSLNSLADIRSAAFSHDGELLAVAGAEHLELWDMATSAIPSQTGAEPFSKMPTVMLYFGNQILFSPDDRRLASHGYKTITIFDVEEQRLLLAHSDRKMQITDITFGPNGDLLATVGGAVIGSETIEIWKIED